MSEGQVQPNGLMVSVSIGLGLLCCAAIFVGGAWLIFGWLAGVIAGGFLVVLIPVGWHWTHMLVSVIKVPMAEVDQTVDELMRE
ncbi:hypothetical protein [Poriferisphaera sp. WC338]|uniref:hypothetical protein n=1 Tax=Poriferisphaera sp. WC338 TaxID=3425129 RepID=UPI003D812655